MADTHGVVVTMNEIYAELQAVHDEVRDMRSDVKSIADHESRIRSLERKIWIAAGIAAAGSGAIVQSLNAVLGA
ncbi:hypothetical protein [Amycolatopsis sp. YIM 10]|uniref:hypothetical protein n=1 Tax=Amycolatopsis sp. YIM 10 TaxID=2653857 RepID=UPI00128FF0EF|nr:hypothetical protein [Amycolatopsis sp. YIM 10]QFU87889.1 hypothetical protein YIM_13515 [Amycolatopsis sp. YIM 10]QFU94798.1 hypothetical protein YIM_48365 [Amycolatopsis sp. YIM 10]